MKRSLGAFMICIFAMPFFVFAQEQINVEMSELESLDLDSLKIIEIYENDYLKNGDDVIEHAESVVVANIGIYDAVLNQNNRDIEIDFDIKNEDVNVQPQVRYSVVLEKITRVDENGSEYGTVVDEYVYKDEFSLNQNESVHKNIIYTVPDVFFGEYRITISANNNNGLPLAIAVVGKINLNEKESSIYINQNTCYLNIKGNKAEYALLEGIDVASGEELIVNCDISSSFEEKIKIYPKLIIYGRTVFGKKVNEKKYDGFAMDAGSTIKFKKQLILMDKPQAYDALLGFYDENGKSISNNIRIHYVIQGLSATIQNIRLDKDLYNKGDIANVIYDFSGRADVFMGSRAIDELEAVTEEFVISFDVEIKGEKGVCASKTNLEPTEAFVWNMEIEKECVNPIVRVKLNDEKGNTLDSSEFAVISKKQDVNDDSNFSIVYKIILAFFIFIFLVLIISLFRHAKNGKIHVSLLVMFFVSSIIIMSLPSGVEALTLRPKSAWTPKPYFTINLGSTNFQNCKPPTVTGMAYVPNCANTIQSKMKVTLNDELFADYYGICHTKWRIHPLGADTEAKCKKTYFKGGQGYDSGWIDRPDRIGCLLYQDDKGWLGWIPISYGVSKELCEKLVEDKKYMEWDNGCYFDLSDYKDIACPGENNTSATTIVASDSIAFETSVGTHDLNFSAAFLRIEEDSLRNDGYSYDWWNLAYGDVVTGKLSYSVNECLSAGFNVTKSCAPGDTHERATISLTNVSGGSNYLYGLDCDANNPFNWSNTNTSRECTFTTAGNQNVRGMVRSGAAGSYQWSDIYEQQIYLDTCPVDGLCAIAYNDSNNCENLNQKPTTGLCAEGTPTLIAGTGAPTDKWTWDCDGIGTGSVSDTGCCAVMDPGQCKTPESSYTYPESNWPNTNDSTFCNFGAPVPAQDLTTFPTIEPNNLTTSWTCNTIGGNSSQCTATLKPPQVSCAFPDGSSEVNIEPSSPLCTGDVVTPIVTFDTNGKWNWNCIHNVFASINDQCQAPSCLAGNPIQYNSSVYLKQDPNDQTTNVSVNCSESGRICCDIRATDKTTGTPTTHVCTGDTDKEIIVRSGVGITYPAQCYIDDGCEATNSCPKVDKPLTISTMCTQKECNAQGSCQATPKASTNLTECSSTCNSNADCSRGRLIETRP